MMIDARHHRPKHRDIGNILAASPSVSFIADGGTQLVTLPTGPEPTGLVVATGGAATVVSYTTSLPPLTPDATPTSDVSSSSSAPSQTAPAKASSSGGGLDRMTLAGIIAAFVALGLAFIFLIVVIMRRARRKRLAEELSRRSFAATGGAQFVMAERQLGGMPSPGVTRRGSKRRTWGGLGSRDHIDVNQPSDEDQLKPFPVPPTSSSDNSHEDDPFRDDASAPSVYSVPPPPSHSAPFAFPTAFLPTNAPSPSSSMDALQSQLRTVSQPRRINITNAPPESDPTSPGAGGMSPILDDPSSFLSFSPAGGNLGKQEYDPTRRRHAQPFAFPIPSTATYDETPGTPTIPHPYNNPTNNIAAYEPSPSPTAQHSNKKSEKAARAGNIRALDNLIAALDEAGSEDERLPDPSVWRAALGSEGGHNRTGSGLAR